MRNIGGYDKNSFYDSTGITFLTQFLQKNHTIKALLQSDDKIPNLDGTIQLLKKATASKSIPAQIFHVQVKTLNSNYVNKNKNKNISQYKYSIDTKVFNVVKNNITSDPVLLFLVDTKNNKVFYLYISMEFIFNLDIKEETNKTIYFNDSNMITNLCNFHNQLMKIHNEKILLSNNANLNNITTNCPFDSNTYSLLQEEWEYLDYMLTNKLKIATNFLFPNTWKFGIAYLKHESITTVGIYRIKKGDNSQYIKDFSDDTNNCFIVSNFRNNCINIREVINNQISSLIKKYYETGYIPAQNLPDIVLSEIAFYFLDVVAKGYKAIEHSNFISTYYKDNEKVSCIIKYWNALIQCELIKKADLLKMAHSSPDSQILCDPIGSLTSPYVKIKEDYSKLFSECLKSSNDKIEKLPSLILFDKKFPYDLFLEVLNQLVSRNIEVIHRPLLPKKYKQMFEQYQKLGLSGYDRKETGYLIEDIYENAKIIANNISEAYTFTAKKIWHASMVSRVLNCKYDLIFDSSRFDCSYYLLKTQGYKFSVSVNEFDFYSVEQMAHDFSKSQNRFYDSICNSNLYLTCHSTFHLYDNIWHLLNIEMWGDCKLKKPILGLKNTISW